MLSLFKKPPIAQAAPQVEVATAPLGRDLIGNLAQQASTLGRESAEVRGVLDDTHKLATQQAQGIRALAGKLEQVVQVQAGIAQEAAVGLQAVSQVGSAVQGVSDEVTGIVQTLREVSDAAGQITQIALQTRLVAFNASVEAKRAGEAGRGFGVVADAVKDLAGKVEESSKEILGTVNRLDERVAALAREISRTDSDGIAKTDLGAVHRALDEVVQGVQRIHAASANSRSVCESLGDQATVMERGVQLTTTAMGEALKRTESFLTVAEQLIETVANCGFETADTPYIKAAQQAAAQISKLLEDAVRMGAISMLDLFDDNYRPVAGSNPAQHTARMVDIAERLFPQVQERVLSLSDKVVFCIAADRNGYIACHNKAYNHPQRQGDVAYNTANCRNRRIFNDRTGLGSARNQRPFLLQTYRRDMGAGKHVVMKEVAAPITVDGRHWGGLRLAFKF